MQDKKEPKKRLDNDKVPKLEKSIEQLVKLLSQILKQVLNDSAGLIGISSDVTDNLKKQATPTQSNAKPDQHQPSEQPSKTSSHQPTQEQNPILMLIRAVQGLAANVQNVSDLLQKGAQKAVSEARHGKATGAHSYDATQDPVSSKSANKAVNTQAGVNNSPQASAAAQARQTPGRTNTLGLSQAKTTDTLQSENGLQQNNQAENNLQQDTQSENKLQQTNQLEGNQPEINASNQESNNQELKQVSSTELAGPQPNVPSEGLSQDKTLEPKTPNELAIEAEENDLDAAPDAPSPDDDQDNDEDNDITNTPRPGL